MLEGRKAGLMEEMGVTEVGDVQIFGEGRARTREVTCV